LCENEEPTSHFIGSIVTMPTASVPEGVSKFLLIDGQQRLTTIFVLLTLLRDMAKSKDDDNLAQEVEQTMLVNPFKRGGDYFKLLPTQIDREAFKALVQSASTNPDSRILQCYQFFERKLKQSDVEVTALNKVVSTRLSVVSIVLDHDDNPHLVFESLNAKGRPLTQSDLIRNYFFMRIHVDEQETTHSKFWEPMQIALGDNLTECIRHYLMRNGSIVKQGDVYFTLKDRVGQGDALKALKDIATFAGYYKNFLTPENEPDPQLRAALVRLKRLEVTTTYPFLLNCYHDYAQGQISADDLLEILQTIENYVIRRFVCNVPTSQLNKIFPLLYQQAKLQTPMDLADGVRSALQSRGYPKDTEFCIRLIDSKLYGAGERLIKTKLILETLEAAHQHKEQPAFDNLTIEHVMPQTLTDWWQNHLGEDWQADHELYLNTLGNLTLTAYNAELSNDTFPEKRHRLGNSHLELNKYFQGVNSWNREAIDVRSKALAKLALTVWPYFGEEQVAPANTDNVTGRTPKAVTILGQRFSVESWRDVQAYTLNAIAQLEPDLFNQLAGEYPRFISADPGKFRRKRQIENGFYIEVNLSAKDVYRFCNQVIDSLGLSSEDWIVETE
ncbi:MAG: DUF262 domain-containing protein, partial [Dethiobacter sp.]|nr:DUF262 domain-containing protein [Dethiobacter sp.]